MSTSVDKDFEGRHSDVDTTEKNPMRNSITRVSRSSLESAYPPDPEDADKRKSVLKGVAGFIIVTEFCERLAYYGFAGSLVLFFQTQLGMTNAEADVQFSAWMGMCYVTPLIGGYIADTYLGRYYAILVFACIYLVGLVLVILGSIPGHVSPIVFFPAIYIITVGTGGIKPNVSTMGADQFDERYSRDRREKESFFNWFYWSINLGALISYTAVAYICQYGAGPELGGQKWGFFVGYTIPALMMALAIGIFVIGTPQYKMVKPKGSVVATAVKICWEAIWTNRNTVTNTEHRLDKAKREFGGSYSNAQVEGVKLVTRLTPFLLMLVPFWGIYSQMSTAFQNQGCQMDLSLGGAVQIPISALNCFDTFSILLLVPVFDQVIYPYCKKIGYPLSMLQKIGWGFVFATVAMFVAAGVEAARLQYAPKAGDWYDSSARDNISPCQNIDNYDPHVYRDWYAGKSGVDKPQHCWQTCGATYTNDGDTYLRLHCIDCDDIPQMSKLSVLWQAFQFSLIGASEILAAITSLEFFYSQAPTSMRSVSQSLNLFTNALGSFIVIPILLMVNANPSDEWVPTNLDEGHLDYYFILLAGLMIITIAVYIYISKDYEYKTTEELSIMDEELQGAEEEGSNNPLTNSDNSRESIVRDAAAATDDSSHGLVYKAPSINDGAH